MARRSRKDPTAGRGGTGRGEKRPSGSDVLARTGAGMGVSGLVERGSSFATTENPRSRRRVPETVGALGDRASNVGATPVVTVNDMSIDDAATRTLRAAGIGLGPRNERLATAAGRHPAREVGSYRLGFSPSMRPVSVPRPVNDPEHRFCARPTCSRHAVATMSYNQASRVVFLGPLSAERDPSLYDLCRFHVDRLTPPTGWAVERARPSVVGEVGGGADVAGAATLGSWSTTLHGMSAELTSAR